MPGLLCAAVQWTYSLASSEWLVQTYAGKSLQRPERVGRMICEE